MKIKSIYDNEEDIPAQYKDLYILRAEKWVLDGIEGIKTDADMLRVQTALRAEQTAHKETKKKFKALEELDIDEVMEKLDRIPELEAAAEKAGTSDEKIQQLVDAKLKTVLAPIERENKQLKDKLGIVEKENTNFKEEKRSSLLERAVLNAARKLKVDPEMEDDVLRYCQAVCMVNEDDNSVVTRDGVGVTPGLEPEALITDMVAKKPKWFQESVSAGLLGGKTKNGIGSNPWAKDTKNLTEQGRITKENPTLATQLKKAAGQ